MDELSEALETLAQAKADLTYEKAIHPTRQLNRLANSKSLYFALCGDAVKIGVSVDPPSRLAVLQTGAPSPIKLLASIPRKGGLEASCHRRLGHLRLYGEWYRYTPEVDSLIEELS